MTFAIAEHIRKATYADRFYIPGTVLWSRLWTPALDDELRDLCGQTYSKEIARRMNLTDDEVRSRMRLLGLTPLSVSEARSPTKGEWVGVVLRIAAEARLHPAPILAGSKAKHHALARARAWKAILDENPGYSVAGVAKVSGHDHTTVMTALRKLANRTASFTL